MELEQHRMALARQMGQAIRERRARWPGGMTLRDLARRSGLAPTTLSGYEQGRFVPSLEAAVILARVLSIDLNAIAWAAALQAPPGAVSSLEPHSVLATDARPAA